MATQLSFLQPAKANHPFSDQQASLPKFYQATGTFCMRTWGNQVSAGSWKEVMWTLGKDMKWVSPAHEEVTLRERGKKTFDLQKWMKNRITMIPFSSGLYHMSPVGKEKKRKVSLLPSLLNWLLSRSSKFTKRSGSGLCGTCALVEETAITTVDDDNDSHDDDGRSSGACAKGFTHSHKEQNNPTTHHPILQVRILRLRAWRNSVTRKQQKREVWLRILSSY